MANRQAILMSAPMVVAILENLKRQTRRIQAPRWQPGDHVYVKEMHRLDGDRCLYAADWPPARTREFRWRPSIHMRRCDSRITLVVEAVRAEPLGAITHHDAKLEGIYEQPARIEGATPKARSWAVPRTDIVSRVGAVDCYRRLWEKINGEGSWDPCQYVFVTTFLPIRRNIDTL